MHLDSNNFQTTPRVLDPAWVPVPKRVRVRFGNEYIADSHRVILKRVFPMFYLFPGQDVNMDFLTRSDQNGTDKWGEKIQYHVGSDGRQAEHAAWSYKEAGDGMPGGIENYIAIGWDAMDAWLEEDEEMRIHPRDPYQRIDVCHSSRHIRIEISGETVAETSCPVLLFETSLPPRFYMRKTDVRMDLLKPTDRHTGCPYKGTASYYSVHAGGEALENLVWTYPFPQAGVYKIKDLVAFFTERLDDVFIDGDRLPKVKTQWSD